MADIELSEPGFDSAVLTAAEIDSISELSRPFAAHWQVVVSQTNWEKGKIIFEWRRQLADSGVAPRLYSDAAWCRIVGEVTPQHAGRLRRTWERFGESHSSYPGLFWSHFFAALDWSDAEMWLEGAVQNNWPISKMRFQRWETMGAIETERPDLVSLVATERDEGVRILPQPVAGDQAVMAEEARGARRTDGPLHEGPDFGDESGDSLPGSAAASAREESHDAFHGDRVEIEQVLDQLPEAIARPYRKLRGELLRLRECDWDGVDRLHLVALSNDFRLLLRKSGKTDSQ
jgi:hypothetical protein